MSKATSKSKVTYTMKQAKQEWADIAKREANNANAIRAARAMVVGKISAAGYSDTVIAKELGISAPEVGKLIAASIAKRAGFDVSATLVAIEEKGNGIEVGKIKSAARRTAKTSELEAALMGIGLTEKRTTGKRQTTAPTFASSTTKAVEAIEKVAKRAIDGKIGLAVIAEAFEDLAAELKAALMMTSES